MTDITTTTYPGRALSAGWLNTYLAAPDDPERPVLHRAICIEQHADGVRLVATDGMMLITSWVPLDDDEYDPPKAPPPSRKPQAAVIAADLDGRMRSLMAHVHKLTTQKDPPPVPVTISVESAQDPNTPALDKAMDRQVVVVEIATERLELATIQGTYPNWKSFLTGELGTVDRIALSPELLSRFGKLRDVGHCRFTFGGETGPITFELVGHAPILGIVMPIIVKEPT